MKVRCSKTSTCCWKWAKRSPFWAPTAWVNPPCWKTLVGELQPDNGSVKWSENAQIGYYAQDHEYEFENDLTVFEWMSQWKQEGDDEQAVRSILGRLLFSRTISKKPAKVLSGGEKGRNAVR